MKKSFAFLCGMLLGLCCLSAHASSEKASASMLISGTVEINPDGSVRQYTLDQPDKLPGIVVTVIKRTVPTWRFQMGTSQNVIAKVRMSIRVLASPAADEKMAFSVEGVSFGEPDDPTTAQIKEHHAPFPVYPQEAISEYASATVYMLLKVGHDGHVMEVAPEQVDFTRPIARDRMASMERVFIASTENALRRWTFDVPVTGPWATQSYVLVQVPVAFHLKVNDRSNISAYGSWQPYLAGPRILLPSWSREQSGLAASPDAIPDQGITPIPNDLRLSAPNRGP